MHVVEDGLEQFAYVGKHAQLGIAVRISWVLVMSVDSCGMAVEFLRDCFQAAPTALVSGATPHVKKRPCPGIGLFCKYFSRLDFTPT